MHISLIVTRGGCVFFLSNRPIIVVTKGNHLYFLEKIVFFSDFLSKKYISALIPFFLKITSIGGF